MSTPTDAADLHLLATAVAALRDEVRGIRRTQLNMYRSVLDLRHEVGHRLGSTSEETAAMLKAVHADLVDRIETLDALVDDQRQRFETLERDLDDLLDDHS